MRPIIISCHTRPVSVVRFNRDGDLFFTGSLDGLVTVFWTDPVERLGTYKSEGAVRSLSVSEDSQLIIIASAINGIFVFNVETGALLSILPAFQIKQVEFSSGSQSFFLIHNFSKKCIVDILQTSVHKKPNLDAYDQFEQHDKKTLISSETLYTKGAWGYLNKTLILGSNKGFIDVFSLDTSEKINSLHPHTEAITDIRFSVDFSLMVTASRDSYCNIYDSSDFKVVRVYNAQRPLNSATISPLITSDTKYHAVIGGGQETRDVTVTKADVRDI